MGTQKTAVLSTVQKLFHVKQAFETIKNQMFHVKQSNQKKSLSGFTQNG
jgi:hypothetical protein